MPHAGLPALRLHYRDLGDGPPLVCLHPGPGLDGGVFLPEFERVAAAGFRVLLLDLPGNGGSEDGDRDDWTLAGFARAVDAFATALGLSDWTLLGHSFGGYVAMRHLTDFPGRAARIVASCTEAWEPEGEEERDPIAGLPPDVAASVRDAFAREEHARTPEDCRAAWHGQAPLFAAAPDGPGVAVLRARFGRARFRVDPHHPRDWGDLDARAALAAARDVPVLAIAGERDRVSPPEGLRAIAGRAPLGTYVEVPGTGHFPWMEDPDGYLGPLVDWLRRTTVGR